MSEHTPEGEAAASAVDSQVTADAAVQVAVNADERAADAEQAATVAEVTATEAEQTAEVATEGAQAAAQTSQAAAEVAVQADEKADASLSANEQLLEEIRAARADMSMLASRLTPPEPNDAPEEVAVDGGSTGNTNTGSGSTQASSANEDAPEKPPARGFRRRAARR